MMDKISLRAVKREATAQALSEAAFQLAREHGLDGFVVDDVAQRAGVSRRTFANYYACKEEAVAMAVMAHHDVDEAQALLDAVPEDAGPLDVLRQLLKAQFTAALLRK